MRSRAYIAFVVLGFVWGSNFIFMKWALALISPAQIVFLRVLFGFLPILGVAFYKGVLTRSHLRHAPHFLAMSVLATAFYYFAFAKGVSLLPSSIAGLLSGSIPLFTFLCAWVGLRKEPPTLMMAMGVAIGFAGILLIAQPWQAGLGVSLIGTAWMLLGALSIGGSFVYARRFLSGLNIPPLALATYQTGFALILLAATTSFTGITHLFADPRASVGLVLGLGLLGTGLAYVLYYYIVAELGAVVASGATYIPPVVALAIGALAGEQVTLSDGIAMTLILAGVAVLQAGRQRPAKKGLLAA
ncbi:hypothetical conserved integral membrane protein [Allgaiera indica]|uniref:EamA-like transporter family protein n=1 Tax=Allgaiera indica TaxID=765699 RepID=A0AAN4USW7_9RHOB|nr:DMT family transporter [Allgaiera indica]GHE02612.1 hypothetical conserved integral membrane protein [Allgaiera indica]SDX20227.1 EamA-like transporter family protein [Allgaiera indica]